jgi:hypothetical protein
MVAALAGLFVTPASATTYFRQQPAGAIDLTPAPTQILFASVGAGKWTVQFNAKAMFSPPPSTQQTHLTDCGVYVNDVDNPAFHGPTGYLLQSSSNLTVSSTDMIPINAVITLTQTSNVAVKCSDANPFTSVSAATLTISPIATLK